jgi:hypothetical protein
MRSYACSCLDAGGCDLLGVSAIPFSVGGNLLGIAGRYWFAFVQHDPLLLPLLRLDCEVEALSRWSAMRFVVNFPGIEESAHGSGEAGAVDAGLRNAPPPLETGKEKDARAAQLAAWSEATMPEVSTKLDQAASQNVNVSGTWSDRRGPSTRRRGPTSRQRPKVSSSRPRSRARPRCCRRTWGRRPARASAPQPAL